MNTQKNLENSGTFPTYLNLGSSAIQYQQPDDASARFVVFSCYANEFTVYQEPPKVEQVVDYK